MRDPLVQGEEWEDVDNVHIPREWLTFNRAQVNAFCRNTDRFVLSGCCPRPFEQMQFIRKTENLWRDGGCIAQCEFGPGANPENVYAVFRAWNGD